MNFRRNNIPNKIIVSNNKHVINKQMIDNEEFFSLILTGNINDVDSYVSKNPNIINEVDKNNENALHKVLNSSLLNSQKLDLVQYLIGKNIQTNVVSNDLNYTPLLLAAKTFNKDIIKLFLEKTKKDYETQKTKSLYLKSNSNNEINITDHFNASPLHYIALGLTSECDNEPKKIISEPDSRFDDKINSKIFNKIYSGLQDKIKSDEINLNPIKVEISNKVNAIVDIGDKVIETFNILERKEFNKIELEQQILKSINLLVDKFYRKINEDDTKLEIDYYSLSSPPPPLEPITRERYNEINRIETIDYDWSKQLANLINYEDLIDPEKKKIIIRILDKLIINKIKELIYIKIIDKILLIIPKFIKGIDLNVDVDPDIFKNLSLNKDFKLDLKEEEELLYFDKLKIKKQSDIREKNYAQVYIPESNISSKSKNECVGYFQDQDFEENLKKYANFNIQDIYGQTCAFYAVNRQNLLFIQAFIEKIDFEIKDKNNMNIIDFLDDKINRLLEFDFTEFSDKFSKSIYDQLKSEGLDNILKSYDSIIPDFIDELFPSYTNYRIKKDNTNNTISDDSNKNIYKDNIIFDNIFSNNKKLVDNGNNVFNKICEVVDKYIGKYHNKVLKKLVEAHLNNKYTNIDLINNDYVDKILNNIKIYITSMNGTSELTEFLVSVHGGYKMKGNEYKSDDPNLKFEHIKELLKIDSQGLITDDDKIMLYMDNVIIPYFNTLYRVVITNLINANHNICNLLKSRYIHLTMKDIFDEEKRDRGKRS